MINPRACFECIIRSKCLFILYGYVLASLAIRRVLILTTPAPSKFIPGNQIFFEFSRWFLGSMSNSAAGFGSFHFAGLKCFKN